MTNPTSPKRRQTTTKINGKRVRIITQNGKTKVEDAPVLEWRLQAAAIKRLGEMAANDNLPPFAFAGDMAGVPLFSGQSKVRAVATGLTPGEHDVRIYLSTARLGLIEYKGSEGRVSKDQKDRHALLHSLGFELQAVIRATDEADAADQTEAVVLGWLDAA